MNAATSPEAWLARAAAVPTGPSGWDFALFFLGGVTGWIIVQLVRLTANTIRSSHQTAEKEFQAALDSTDLAVLSRYLKQRLGSLSLQDYVGKSQPRKRVDQYIAKLTAFVGTEPETTVPSGSADHTADQPSVEGETTAITGTEDDLKSTQLPHSDPRLNDPEILKEARSLVESGMFWTALATLRRDLETRMGRTSDGPPAQLADVSVRFGPEVAKHYDRFRRVANRAIHGEDVKLESARAAINSARVVYDALDQAEKKV